ncbi:hypothetical protein B0H13DRAFT_2276632 [Mycena leptocephala]|nr:hypothetical protein B0H13DRAFT_2276632 [Mycena leptocephala]
MVHPHRQSFSGRCAMMRASVVATRWLKDIAGFWVGFCFWELNGFYSVTGHRPSTPGYFLKPAFLSGTVPCNSTYLPTYRVNACQCLQVDGGGESQPKVKNENSQNASNLEAPQQR